MAVGEDGSIREYDLRDSALTERVFEEWPGEGISLNSLSVSPLRPHWVAVCGTGPITRIFDRRKWGSAGGCAADSQRAWIHGKKNAEMTTSLKFSSYSMDLVSSVIDDKIYLLNYDLMLEGAFGLKKHASFLKTEEERYTRLGRKLGEGNLEGYVKESLKTISEHRGLQYALLPLLRRVLAYELYNVILASMRREDKDTAYDSALELLGIYKYRGETSEDREVEKFHRLAFLVLKDDLPPTLNEYHGELDQSDLSNHEYIDILQTSTWERLCKEDIICTSSNTSFKGHVNRQTVKDVNFVGPRHEYVMSGSDGGVFFIWNRESGDMVFLGRGDSMVVNCLTENPRFPTIATAGIDSDIKLWEPSDAPIAPEIQWFPIPRHRWEETMDSIRHPSTIATNVVTIPCHVQ